MSETPEQPRILMNMNHQEVKDFLHRLSHDDDFRAQILKDPHGTLAPYRIYLDPSIKPGDISLPPKHELSNIMAQSSPAVFIHGPFTPAGPTDPSDG